MSIEIDAKKATFEILYNRLIALSGIVLYLVVMIAIYQPFKELVPEGTRAIWRNLCIITVSYTIIQQSAYVYFERFAPHLVVQWRKYENLLELLFNLLIASMVVLFMPYANESLRVILIAVAVTYVPNTILADPENAEFVVVSSVIVMAATSYAIWQLGGTNYHVFAVIMAIYALFLIASVCEIKRVVLLATTKRIEAEVANNKLAAANKQLSFERDSKTRFIAAASHDLSQPLHAASLSFENLNNAKNEKSKNMALENGRAAFQMASDLVSQMLNHLRLEADAVSPINEIVSFDELYSELNSIYSATAHSKNIVLQFKNNAPAIFADKTLLKRAIGNLIENAIIHSGGQNISVESSQVKMGNIQISVFDNGKGIKTHEAALVFDDYFQGEKSFGQALGGFGLGLSSVKRIAKILGGDVLLDKDFKNGAKFVIDLNNPPSQSENFVTVAI